MKIILYLFTVLSFGSAVVAEPILREVQSGEIISQYATESAGNIVIWRLRIKDGAVLWTQSFNPTSPVEKDKLTNSQLTAFQFEQDKYSALISCESSLLWICGQKNAEGVWVTSFEGHLYGIASHKLRTKSIELPSINVVRITSESGEAISFTRTEQRSILRNGLPYANKPEGSLIITKP